AGQSAISLQPPVGPFMVGNSTYVLESAVSGTPALKLILTADPAEHYSNVNRYLPILLRAAISLGQTLKGLEGIPELDPSWREIPSECRNSNSAKAPTAASVWVHHGDFTIENAFLDQESRVSLIDWEHATSGAPSIYDAVNLLLSVLPAIDSPEIRQVSDFRDRLPLQFREAFFTSNPLGKLLQSALKEAYEAFEEPRERWYDAFLVCLSIRAHYHGSRGSGHTPAYRKMVDMVCDLKDSFLASLPS
ncbi:MAG TPA: phosphotransferase, partial [Terriglobales bacterium]|nr:phosphotransferase [Terriglobales bacterium]